MVNGKKKLRGAQHALQVEVPELVRSPVQWSTTTWRPALEMSRCSAVTRKKTSSTWPKKG
jgi:hypothetical protein